MQIVTKGNRKTKVPVGWYLLRAETRIKSGDMSLEGMQWKFIPENEIGSVCREKAVIRKLKNSSKGEIIKDERFVKELK